MASAMPAYRLDAYPDASPSRLRDRDLRAVRTQGPSRAAGAAEQTTAVLITAAKMAAVVLVVVTALCFARIALTSAAVTSMVQSDELSTQIAEARSAGVGLEMEQSVLSNTSAINASAGKLHMVAPSEVGTIALSPDIVALTDEGALSLSATVENLVGIQG